VCQAGLWHLALPRVGPKLGLTPSKRNAISPCATNLPSFAEMHPNVLDEFGGISEEADSFSRMLSGGGASYPAPPPQIPPCGFPAVGSRRRSNAIEGIFRPWRAISGRGSAPPPVKFGARHPNVVARSVNRLSFQTIRIEGPCQTHKQEIVTKVTNATAQRRRTVDKITAVASSETAPLFLAHLTAKRRLTMQRNNVRIGDEMGGE
jgi:hypothetical protein